jgi:cobalt-zinc-cadmium efflux system outer membrane protein
MSQIPNYVAGISELFEIGKRGPRQRAARHASDAVLLEASNLLKQRVLTLIDAVGRVAAGQARVAALTDVVADAAALTTVQRARVERGDIADLDLARALLDEQKLRASLADARQKQALALAECAAVLAVPCQPFTTADKARAFVETRSALPVGDPSAGLAERPDVLALEAQARSANAAEELGRARRIPDVTFRLGFTYDQFVISGNQEKSFSLGASIPIPIFERGKNDAAQAAAAARSAELGRAYLLEQANRELPVLLGQLADLQQRRAAMKGQIVPLARSVVERLDTSVRVGGASIQEVLLARRTLGEVLLDSIDLDLTALQLALQVRRVTAPAPKLPNQSGGSPS